MKVVKLRFDDKCEKSVSASDPRLQCVRTSDGLVAGDLCRYSDDGRVVVAEVIDVFEVEATESTPAVMITREEFVDGFAQLREEIKNDIVSEFQKFRDFLQTSFASDVSKSNRNLSPGTQTSDRREIDDLEIVDVSEPPSKRSRRPSTSSSIVSVQNSGENDSLGILVSNRNRESLENGSIEYRRQQSVSNAVDSPWSIKVFHDRCYMPPNAYLRVQTPDGSYVRLDYTQSMAFDDLLETFKAKWSQFQLPAFAEKLNLTSAVAIRHLRDPCLRAFNNINPQLFVSVISCYLFDMGVLHSAFLPGPNTRRELAIRNKRYLNDEAKEAFFFLVYYFSTIAVNPSNPEHALWTAVIRNCFNRIVTRTIKNDELRLKGMPLQSGASFTPHVIPGFTPIFNCQTAFD